MSGVYIKGMEMPTNCSDCPMCYDMMQCTVAEPIINFFKVKDWEFDFCTERHPRCPLVPVPEHGRLIDADALVRDNGIKEIPEYYEAVCDAPTIIPADHIGDANEMVADKEGEG